VAAVDAKFKGKKPVRTFNLPEASGEGTSAAYWGTPDTVERLSVVEKNLRGRFLQGFYWQRGLLIAARQRHLDYGGYIDSFTKETPVEMELVDDDRFEFDGELVLRQRSFGRKVATERSEAERLKAYANSYRRLTLTPEAKAPNGAACRWICVSREALECLAYQCQ
jgi:transposase